MMLDCNLEVCGLLFTSCPRIALKSFESFYSVPGTFPSSEMMMFNEQAMSSSVSSHRAYIQRDEAGRRQIENKQEIK